MQSATTSTVGTQTYFDANNSEELPSSVLEKALKLIEYFECEIVNLQGGQVILNFLRDDLPVKVLILEDELLIYLHQNDMKHLRSKLIKELREYIDRKIGNILKDLRSDERLRENGYLTLMRSVKKACQLSCNF
jgi:hypothetical protein